MNKLILKTNYISEKKRYKGVKKKPKKRCRGETCCSFKISSKETISQYFYMPITQAAKEPNLGLAPLKKRCREPNLRLAPLKKRCREPEVDEPPC